MNIKAWMLNETKYKYSFSDVAGVAEEPKKGVRKLGPYSKNKFHNTKIGICILCPDEHKQVGQKFYKCIQNGLLYYKPFHTTYKINNCYYAPMQTFQGVDGGAYRRASLDLIQHIDSTKADIWLCYVVIENSFKDIPATQNPYYISKAILLSNQILVQSITVEKAKQSDSDLQWILDSISLQSYVKIGGTPWTVESLDSVPEIIMGIGEARLSQESKEHIFGYATVFNQNGAYLWTGFGKPALGFDEYIANLQKRIVDSIDEYTRVEKVPPKRLIIHLYKPSGRRTEVAAIENGIAQTNSQIEFAILHVDHNTDFRIFDDVMPDLKPYGKVAVYIDELQRLIVLSGREIKWIPPRVARLHLSPLSTYRDLNSLTQQAYNFTKIHWAGFQPNNVPVTLRYPSQLAQKYGNLEKLEGDWYKLITSSFLFDKIWFI